MDSKKWYVLGRKQYASHVAIGIEQKFHHRQAQKDQTLPFDNILWNIKAQPFLHVDKIVATFEARR